METKEIARYKGFVVMMGEDMTFRAFNDDDEGAQVAEAPSYKELTKKIDVRAGIIGTKVVVVEYESSVLTVKRGKISSVVKERRSYGYGGGYSFRVQFAERNWGRYQAHQLVKPTHENEKILQEIEAAATEIKELNESAKKADGELIRFSRDELKVEEDAV